MSYSDPWRGPRRGAASGCGFMLMLLGGGWVIIVLLSMLGVSQRPDPGSTALGLLMFLLLGIGVIVFGAKLKHKAMLDSMRFDSRIASRSSRRSRSAQHSSPPTARPTTRPDARRCRVCYKQASPDARFCGRCGTRV